MSITFGRRLAVIATALFVAAAPSSPIAASAPSGEDDPIVIEIARQMSESYGIDLSRAEFALQQQSNASRFATKIDSLIPDTYAGFAASAEDPAAFTVYVTDLAVSEQIENLANEYGVVDVSARLVQTSKRDLETLFLKLSDIAVPVYQDFFMVSTDVESNAVRIDVNLKRTSESEVRAILAPLGDLLSNVQFGSDYKFAEAADADCNIYACNPPLRGGVLIQDVGGGPSCTLGVNGFNRANGQPEFLTAAHCGVHNWKTNAHNIGGTRAIKGPGELADVQAVGIFTSEQAFWNPQPLLYVRSGPVTPYSAAPNQKAPVRGVILNSGIFLRQYLCQSGASSLAMNCGRVTNSQTTAYYGVGNTTWSIIDAFIWSGCIHEGDSGGPIFDKTYWVAGLVASHGPAACSNGGSENGDGGASKIQNAANIVNFTPITQ